MAITMHPIGERPILVEQVYQRLRQAITRGKLAPGLRVRQAELADQLGVSRAPVSHALHLLKHERLVVENGRRGLQVAPLDPDQLRDHYQVRAALDSLAARLLAIQVRDQVAGNASLAALDKALQKGAVLDVESPQLARVQADVEFHRVIYVACGNTAIEDTVQPLWPHIERAMHVVLEADEFRDRAWDEHAQIVRSIRAGDPEASADAAWRHAANAGAETEARLRARIAA